MDVKQVFELVNSATGEALGTESILTEDLSNVVDLGYEIFNAGAVDKYVKSLVNHIGKVVFVNRPYKGAVPSVLMDGWEFGSVLEKVQADLPEATENESWELEDGTSYDPNIFYKPSVSAKFFNSKTTFEIPMSFTEMQVKQSFSSAAQLNGFVSMLFNAVDKAMTVKVDALIMRTINNMICETLFDEYGASSTSSTSGVRAVNLLYLYNNKYGTSLTASKALVTPEFIRFAVYTMKVYKARMSRISTLFNVGGKERFTPPDLLHTVLLADFKASAEVFLYDAQGQFKDEYLAIGDAETVPFWQGSGTSYDFDDISNINIITSGNHSVDLGGVLAVMFDRDALGVTNLSKRVTTNYNPKAEFYSNWYKFDAGFFNDLNENFVVFFIA